MSYDRKIEQVCTHGVVGEALFVNQDRLTLRPLRPIANINSVRVRYNGLLEVPSSGAHVPAQAKGSLPGPFDIQAGVNDTLIISVDGNPDQTLVMPAGKGISAAKLTESLNRLTNNLFFEVTAKNQVKVKTRSTGAASRIQFKEGSSLALTLALNTRKVYRGQRVMPSWSLINDPNTLGDRPARLIFFDSPINGTNDYFEIDYTVIRQECRRCGGSGVENDWRYDQRGNVITVKNTDLLMQEVLKITYTEKGSNPFHEWYGTGILEAIGQKLSDSGLIQNLILSDIRDAFKRWQSIKTQQEDQVGQFVSDEEFPFRLLVVNLEQDDNDPTVVYVNAVVQSRSTQPIQISRGLKLPIPFDLLGSSVQDTLLRANEAKTLQPFR